MNATLSHEDIELKLDLVNGIEYGNPEQGIRISATVEHHAGGDFTIWLDHDLDEIPRTFHAVYNDFPAFTDLVDRWADSTNGDEIAAEIEALEDAYNQAILVGHGDWHLGVHRLTGKVAQ